MTDSMPDLMSKEEQAIYGSIAAMAAILGDREARESLDCEYRNDLLIAISRLCEMQTY